MVCLSIDGERGAAEGKGRNGSSKNNILRAQNAANAFVPVDGWNNATFSLCGNPKCILIPDAGRSYPHPARPTTRFEFSSGASVALHP